jgi:16S rRNA (cytosine1402-N4)-methyltransferase
MIFGGGSEGGAEPSPNVPGLVNRQGQVHVSVLMDEVMFLLRPRRGGWVIDGTVGLGGHAERMLEAAQESRLLGIDQDPEALRRAGRRLARFGDRALLKHGSFRQLASLAHEAGVADATAILLDLGLSSYQLDESGRGFSFQRDEVLDMRFDPTRGRTAAELLNSLSPDDLTRILSEYGEERHARRIARRIADRRRRSPLETTGDLVAAVKEAVPRAAWSRRIHVATRTFQAVRMAVNNEAEALAEALPHAASLLGRSGRLGVISFHSGEDRIVKHSFRLLQQSGGFALLLPSPIQPAEDEARDNPRARSAKLRVLERVEAA